MALLDTHRTAANGTNFFGLVHNAFGTLATWNDARTTRKALNALSNRELEDIGLCRGDIEAIATRGPRF